MCLTVFDLEGDGFTPTKIHVMSRWTKEYGLESTRDYDTMRGWITTATVLIGHNIILFDLPVVYRLLGVEPKGQVIDTLGLSWYLYPTRIRHGLESWGQDLGVKKPDIVDWENLSYEEYKHRCEEDVKINTKLWERIDIDLNKLYKDTPVAKKKLIRYITFKLNCYSMCADSKVKLDRDLLIKNYNELIDEKKRLADILRVDMPPKPVFKVMSRPKKPYKKDGSLSATGEKWKALLIEQGVWDQYGIEYPYDISFQSGFEEPNPGSHDQVKEWLFSLGWVPRTFKKVKDEKVKGGKRKVPQIKHADIPGEVCDSIVELAEKVPSLLNFGVFFILTHRISFLKAMLEDMDEDNCITATIGGFTNTMRFKHTRPLANIPKPDVLYGDKIRSVIVARDGHEFCGSDMSSLEDRTKLHYMYPHDPEYVEEMSTPGFDPHLDLALIANRLTAEEVQAYKDGDKTHKGVRHMFKTTNYACVYGAGAPTIAEGAACTLDEAKELVETYWKRNWAVKVIAEEQVVKKCLGVKWLWNPVSKMWYWLKYEKDRFSTLNQGTAVYCFDVWVKEVLDRRGQLTGQWHDEILLEIKEGVRDKCTKLLRESIDAANKKLKLNRELDIGIEYGPSYAEVH